MRSRAYWPYGLPGIEQSSARLLRFASPASGCWKCCRRNRHSPPENSFASPGRVCIRGPRSTFWTRLVSANIPRRSTGGWGEGILTRHFHLYPLLVDPVQWARPKGTIDGDYLAHAVPDRTQIYVVWDSDELVVFDLAAEALCARGRRSWSQTWRAARIAAQCDAHQITYWQHSMYLHADDRGPDWDVVEQEAERFAQRVLRRRAVAGHLFPLMNRIRGVQQRWERVFRLWRRSLPKVRRKQLTRPVRVTVHRLRKRWRR